MEIRREILEKLIKMENYLEELEKIYPDTYEKFYTDLEKKYASYFLFVLIVEELSDILSLLAIKYFAISDDFYTDLERVSKKISFLRKE